MTTTQPHPSHPTTPRPPGFWRAVRYDYEVLGMSQRMLSRKYGVPHNTIGYNAKKDGWQQQDPTELALNVENAVFAEGLQINRGMAVPINVAREAIRAAQRPGRPLGSRTRRKAVKPENPVSETENPANSTLTENEVNPVNAEAPAESATAEPAPTPELSPLSPVSPPEAKPVEPEPGTPGSPDWLKLRSTQGVRTADVVAFPRSASQPSRQAAAVEDTITLPAYDKASVAERERINVTLAAIRAMMTLEQVQQLDHHRNLLARYAHLLEVYLDPTRFVDVSGLDETQQAEKIIATQKLALRLLLPSEHDTLAGALKVLTQAMQANIQLSRTVAGADHFRGGILDKAPQGHDGQPTTGLVSLETMSTPQLRHVQRAMELIQRHHHAEQAAPKPPSPESIDDLLDAPTVTGDGDAADPVP